MVHRILLNTAISRNKGERFHSCLCDQEPVERITVQWWKAADLKGMFG